MLPLFVVYSICGRVETPYVFPIAGYTQKPIPNPVASELFILAVMRQPLMSGRCSCRRYDRALRDPTFRVAGHHRSDPAEGTRLHTSQNVLALLVAPATAMELTRVTTPGAAVFYFC